MVSKPASQPGGFFHLPQFSAVTTNAQGDLLRARRVVPVCARAAIAGDKCGGGPRRTFELGEAL